jgi:hypothetical protein
VDAAPVIATAAGEDDARQLALDAATRGGGPHRGVPVDAAAVAADRAGHQPVECAAEDGSGPHHRSHRVDRATHRGP